MLFRKGDKLIPIITAVVYFGDEPWDGPRSLFEMLDVRDVRLYRFLSDYKLNLISPADMDDDDFGKFQTDLGFAMKLLKHQLEDADELLVREGNRKVSAQTAYFLNAAMKLNLEFDSELVNISTSDAKGKINAILNNAVERIVNTVNDNPKLAAMGAALAGLVFCSDGILIFNCGDCRVYRQQGQYLEKLSHDHSIVQELFDKGEIEEDAMRIHAKKGTITACVSAEASYLNIYFREISNKRNERFLICSDGIWEALPIEKIEACLCENTLETANKLAQKLLDLQEYCKDNISLIIVE